LAYRSAYLLPLLFLGAPLIAQQPQEGAQSVRPSTGNGLEIFSGAEFQNFELPDGNDAEKFVVPITARLTAGRVRVSAQLPYMRVTAPGNVVVPSGPLGLPIVIDPSKPSEEQTREGVGDLRVGVAYQLPIPAVNASLNSGAKIPTASAQKGLGTGEADYWVGGDLSVSAGAVTPFAGINYTKAGDPDGIDLRDTLSGQAGAALRLGRTASAHVGYSYAENASNAAPDEQRIFGGVNTGVGKALSIGVYGSAGVSGPADIGAGVSLGLRVR
jgi:hypothetical protein